jgi:succinate dehydrogenase/fumarate reductase flavoprotein subunit
MPAENLKASVAGYKPEGDAFGKDLAKFERLGTISEDAAYYVAFTGCPYIYSTCGGLDVNENFQVLNTEGEVIPGLFACGEVLDIDGDCGGYNLQWAWASGRMAGRLGT